jgi:hypothetical protein
MIHPLAYITHILLIAIITCLSPNSSQAASHTSSTGRIEVLLLKARQALASNRITAPREHSAVSYAEQILAINPNHQGAIDILQQAIHRYNTLGLTAVERAKTLRKQELNKAEDYHQRAKALAERHRLDTMATQPLTEQLASEQNTAATLRDERKFLQTQLTAVAAGYISLAETALAQGYVQDARRYQIAAEVLSNTPYKLPPNNQLAALTARLERLESVPQANNRSDIKNKIAISSGSTEIFLPPAF